jgi:hypothetical protein
LQLPPPAPPSPLPPPPPSTHRPTLPVPLPSVPFISDSDMLFLRSRLPNLAGMSDLLLRVTPINTLIALNDSSHSLDQGNLTTQISAPPSGHSRDSDPGLRMAKSLELLRDNPTTVPAAPDDRLGVLHPARFLGGAVCGSKKLWLAAREVIGLDGVTPLANYDLATVGLGGCVTNRGWIEIHNPASASVSLKLFSSSNMGSATCGTKRLTLADGDAAITVGDQLKEIAHLEEFKHAIRAACRAMSMALPWNHSFHAIDGWLHSSNYGANDLSGRPDRVPLLVDFVNYIFGLNANAWIQKEPFHSAGEIKTLWGEWFGSRPASLLTTAPLGTAPKGNPRRPGFGTPSSGQNSGTPARLLALTHTPPPADQVCRRYNANACPNHHTSCYTAAGVRLLHVCDAVTAQGHRCGRYHPRVNHK